MNQPLTEPLSEPFKEPLKFLSPMFLEVNPCTHSGPLPVSARRAGSALSRCVPVQGSFAGFLSQRVLGTVVEDTSPKS